MLNALKSVNCILNNLTFRWTLSIHHTDENIQDKNCIRIFSFYEFS